jgi:hypothetical protein
MPSDVIIGNGNGAAYVNGNGGYTNGNGAVVNGGWT